MVQLLDQEDILENLHTEAQLQTAYSRNIRSVDGSTSSDAPYSC